MHNYTGHSKSGRGSAHNAQVATKTDLISTSSEVSYFRVNARGKGMKLKSVPLLLTQNGIATSVAERKDVIAGRETFFVMDPTARLLP